MEEVVENKVRTDAGFAQARRIMCAVIIRRVLCICNIGNCTDWKEE